MFSPVDRNEKAPAIVIRTERRGERDRIATLLSPVWGLKNIVVYGAQKSRKAVKAPLYTEAVFNIYNSREKGSASLVDLNLISIHENLFSSLPVSFSATLISEITLVSRGEDAPLWYQLVTSCFDSMDEGNWRCVTIQFIVRALELGGRGSDWEHCPVCQKEYEKDEILGYNTDLSCPCCHSCDSLDSALILPPNARRYVHDSMLTDLESALSFRISTLAQKRILRYLVRLYNMSMGTSLRSAGALLDLDDTLEE